VGQTTDSNGERGFCLTLATREQHIRREKATSNICTNQALCALMVTIFLSAYGKQGLRELALQNLSKAQYAARRFRESGAELRFSGPFFNELVVQGIGRKRGVGNRLAIEKILGGLDLGRYYSELDGDILLCFTETAPREKIERVVEIYTD
jgi:glycine dehydrogenase subunit 1